MTRVAVVAASPVLRAGLEALLGRRAVDRRRRQRGRAPRAGRGRADRGARRAARADVVVWVVDGVVDGAGDGLAALRADDGSVRGGPAVLLLTDLVDPRAAARAVRAGVRGVLPREAGADEIVAAVEAVAAGLVALPADVADELLGPAPASARVTPASAGLAALEAGVSLAEAGVTPREREVLALLAQGLANKAIAPRLGISEHTVKAHVASIFEKLHAGTRAEAVVTAARLGLLLL
jgi:DNA-binding NarL/FixJ family response regulator